MKIYFILFVVTLYLISVQGRLLPLNKTKNLEGAQTDHPNPSIRQTRDVEDMLTGISNEGEQSAEFVNLYNKRKAHFMKSDSFPYQTNKVRVVRESNEKKVVDKSDRKAAKPVMVKKPIPKFNELDYEEDFQTRLIRAHASVVDSSDHEDEDFNLDDYDFDVNHDEYASRGKPLEPREHMKNTASANAEPKTTPKVEVKKPSKVTPRANSKKQRSAMPANSVKIIDYYDDYSNATVAKNTTSIFEDTSEPNTKKPPIRAIRSWDFRNIRPIASNLRNKVISMPRLLGVLPLFPQISEQDDSLAVEKYYDISDI